MNDPWKYLAFPAAAVAGYLLSHTALSVLVGDFTGLSDYISEILVIAVTGLIAGFLVDEVIPTYLEHVREGGGAGDIGGDFGGGEDDFDLE